MYPVIRLLTTLVHSHYRPALTLDAVDEIHFYCRPWDLDFFGEMNNGRVLTLYDLGRFSLAVRTGLGRVLREKRWGLAVAGSAIRYRQRVHLFNRVSLRTRVLGVDERWFYIEQSMWVRGQPASSVVMRTCVTEKGRMLPAARVLKAMQVADQAFPLPAWAAGMFAAASQRPWPPEI
ncbi:MAG: acyl-CoA thioesterase [Thiothrix sp.]|nr:acyl-CoA thioesterase [Thiothrix sp.]HPE61914.1 acyl-CoA thioesterase [Thiolinea sp.]